MTHGCLDIREASKRDRILLHTYHTGMDIPKAVRAAVKLLATETASWLLRSKPKLTLAEAHHAIDAHALYSKLEWPPTVAALIIAATPCFLAPYPPAFSKHLAKWSGKDHPYKLTVSEDRWILKSEERKVIYNFNPRKLLAHELVAMADIQSNNDSVVHHILSSMARKDARK